MINAFYFLKSNIFIKALMALSGLLMVGFLLGHMGGNLLVFLGPDALNNYAHKIHSMPELLWVVRLGLLACLITHVLSAIILTKRNKKNSTSKYKIKTRNEVSKASLNMGLTGFLIFLYIIYHLSHFTLKLTHPEFKQNPSDVYNMVIASFQSPILSIIYVISMFVLGVHLYHGIASATESLGFHHAKFTPILKKTSIFLCLLIVLGFISVPASVILGIIK